MEMSELRKAMQKTRGTIRHASKDADGGAPKPPSGRHAAGESKSDVRSVSFAI